MNIDQVINLAQGIGGIGVLALLCVLAGRIVPKMIADNRKSREAELARWQEEREADREARKQGSERHHKAVSEAQATHAGTVRELVKDFRLDIQDARKQFLEEYRQTRDLFLSEIRAERAHCNEQLQKVLLHADRKHDEMKNLVNVMIGLQEREEMDRLSERDGPGAAVPPTAG